jgi:hypothetical protein
MRPNQLPRSIADYSDNNGNNDLEFQDFVASVTVTKEELAVLTGTREYSSIYEVREHLKAARQATGASQPLRDIRRHVQRIWAHFVAAAIVATGSHYRSGNPRKT